MIRFALMAVVISILAAACSSPAPVPTKATFPSYVTPVTGTLPTQKVFITATAIAQETATASASWSPAPTPTPEFCKLIVSNVDVPILNVRDEASPSGQIISQLVFGDIVEYGLSGNVHQGFEWHQLSQPHAGKWIAVRRLPDRWLVNEFGRCK